MDTNKQSFPFIPVGFDLVRTHSEQDHKKLKKIRKNKGIDWEYYYTTDIEYKDNELGYRSRTVFPTEKYAVALGCSNTYGLYLREENRYSNILENKLGMPVINLGITGGSANAINLNISMLLHSNYNNPCYVFIQWPKIDRYVMFDTVPHPRPLRIRAGGDFSDIFTKLVKNGNSIQTMTKISSIIVKNTLKSLNIPLIDFAVDRDVAEFHDCTYIKRVDSAMDDSHIGTITNKKIAEFIENAIR